MRRRFSTRERVALYLAAGGRCTTCGAALEPGWHADHIYPHVRGGATDVINGQALCPACNLRKGCNVTDDLRTWQREALRAMLDRPDRDFSVVACPGAGKTRFALAAAGRFNEIGLVDRVVVVVPTRHLCTQWAQAALDEAGITLNHQFQNGDGALAPDFDGVVVTYQAVAMAPLLYRKLTADRRTLVVLDEVHHCGDRENLAWGRALLAAFEPAVKRLLLSGTPFRTDGAAIPFLRYRPDKDGKQRADADVNYDYGTALLDRIVVRPVEFIALDGSVSWRRAIDVAPVEVALGEANDDQMPRALEAAYDPAGQWIASVLRKADEELTRHREAVPDAGGLVVAASQWHAKQYAHLLRTLTGEQPEIVISDEDDPSTRIQRFKDARSRWIVAVQMVAEGVDIPRLAVGVYASRYKTEMFFRQVVGRFVRTRDDDDDTVATVLVPSIEPFIRFASQIQKTVDAALREDEERIAREAKSDAAEQATFDLIEVVASSEAIHHSTILSGESYSDEELARALTLQERAGIPGNVSTAQVARLLRLAGHGEIVGRATINRPAPPKPLLADQKTSLRREVQSLVGRYHYATQTPHNHIHAELNRLCGGPIKTADLEQIQRRIALLRQWIGEA